MPDQEKSWLKRAMSEGAPDYEPSTARLLLAIVVVVALGLQVAVTIAALRHRGPYTLVDASMYMASLGGFVTTVGGLIYGVNKVTTMISDMYSSKNVNIQNNQPVLPSPQP